MHDPNARLSCKDVFPVLEDWAHLVRIERNTEVYDGKITALSQDAGTLDISTVVRGEGKKTVRFELAGADFERSSDPGEWEEVFVVFPRSSDWFTLRKWKK